MARFTMQEMVTRARRLSRTTSNVVSDQEVGDLLNEGLREFGKEVQGIWNKEYLYIIPKFSVGTNWYYTIHSDTATATVVVSTISGNLATGSTLATVMTTHLQAHAGNWATASIVWSPTEWAMIAEVPSSTYVEISSPTINKNQVDATPYIWGGIATQTTASFLGSFPQNVTVETEFPSGFLSVLFVEWDDNRLTPAPASMFISPESTAENPSYYYISTSGIRLFPTPTRQKLFEMWYRKLPVEFGEASASGSLTGYCSLPQGYELAPMYYAASMMAEENFEGPIADRYRAKFLLQCYKYTQQLANNAPQLFPREVPFKAPTVDPTTP